MLTYPSSKFGAISDNFKIWLQIYLERIDIPKIDNKLDRLSSLPRWTKKFGELWSTNKQVAGVDVDTPQVDNARSAYATAFDSRPRDFATR